MPSLEIERKFLVVNDLWKQEVVTKSEITQGYISENFYELHLECKDHDCLKIKFSLNNCDSFIYNLNISKEDALLVKKYFDNNSQKVVRIRSNKTEVDTNYFLTIKFASEDGGISRLELERELPSILGENLMSNIDKYLSKIRYLLFPRNNYTIEIDQFLGENEGLILAEIELQDVSQQIKNEKYLGIEVTGDINYYNSNLINSPFKNWDDI
jgi:adenylate cyclase